MHTHTYHKLFTKFNLDDEAIYKKRANELDVVQNENKASTRPRSQAIAVRCTEKCTQPIFKAIIKRDPDIMRCLVKVNISFSVCRSIAHIYTFFMLSIDSFLSVHLKPFEMHKEQMYIDCVLYIMYTVCCALCGNEKIWTVWRYTSCFH